MTVIQNPTVPTPTDPIEIDKAIESMRTILATWLPWLSNNYGRAYEHADVTQSGDTRIYPEVYLGTQNNSQRYTIVTPDNDKEGQCFFFVTREVVNDFQVGNQPYLTYNLAAIFSANLDTIDSTLTDTTYFQQVLAAQVRQVFIDKILGGGYVVTLNECLYNFRDVFREFTVENREVLEKAPLTHFRWNMTVNVISECIDLDLI